MPVIIRTSAFQRSENGRGTSTYQQPILIFHHLGGYLHDEIKLMLMSEGPCIHYNEDRVLSLISPHCHIGVVVILFHTYVVKCCHRI